MTTPPEKRSASTVVPSGTLRASLITPAGISQRGDSPSEEMRSVKLEPGVGAHMGNPVPQCGEDGVSGCIGEAS